MSVYEGFVRYFCHLKHLPSKGVSVADLGWDYFESMLSQDIRIRLIPLNACSLSRKDSRWKKHAKMALSPVPDVYINVVCGYMRDIEAKHTTSVPNVAIVNSDISALDEGDVAALSKYDAVICPDIEYAKLMRDKGIASYRVVASEAEFFASLLKDIHDKHKYAKPTAH